MNPYVANLLKSQYERQLEKQNHALRRDLSAAIALARQLMDEMDAHSEATPIGYFGRERDETREALNGLRATIKG